MGLCDPKNCPFPVFARISRVRIFTIGPKFHRLSVSRPYSCVESLKKVRHSSPEIWAFVTPKMAPLVFARISRVRIFTIGPKFHRLSVSWPYSCVKSLKKVGHSGLEIWAFVTPKMAPFLCLQGLKVGYSSLEIWAFVTPKMAPFLCLQGYLEFGSLQLAQNFTDCPSPGHTAVWKV